MSTNTIPKDPSVELPVAERRPLKRTFHSLSHVDDYAWLKDANWQKVLRDPSVLDPEIRAYLEAENRYAEALLKPTEALQKALVAEMRGRIKEDDASVPQPDGPFAYLSRYREGGQHPLIGRLPRDGDWRQGDGAAVVLDGDQLAKDSTYFRFGGTRHSPDHRLEAWCADRRGSEFYTIRVRDWQSGEDLSDVVEQTSGGSVVWGLDSTFFLYVQVDENHRPLKVYRHRLGAPQREDVLVYEEKDTGWFTRVHLGDSRRFCFIESGDHETSECRLVDLAVPEAMPRLVAERQTGVRYSVYDRGEELFILTDEGNAIDFRIAVAPIATPDRSHWRELIAHRPGVYIVNVTLYADYLVRLERSNALPAIVVRRLSDGQEHAIAFDEAAYALDVMGGYEFDTTTLRFAYSSMTTPSEVWDYDMANRTRVLRKRQEIPSGHDPAQYVTTRIMAPSWDGAEVPVSILHRRDFERDGSAPLLLYGYGSYGMAMPASFSANRLSLVDRGFAYAIAHIRGGSDKGYGWYLDGKREKKTNTFADYEAAARALIARGYTSAGRIVGHGASAGGMLMGAVANRAPELFAGLVAEVPFVDVLNTM
ncbi:MAG: S9 family peptidase, partial [Alphaproteobacteria bacterium]|nr:S9 family peptidase [Alphaproteobacteria bacterium]